MHNLLEDPVFYGLLTNNSESNISRSNSSISSNSNESNNEGVIILPKKRDIQSTNDCNNINDIDFSFLNKLSFPQVGSNNHYNHHYNNNNNNANNEDIQPLDYEHGSSLHSSYQQSLFSEAISLESLDTDSSSLKDSIPSFNNPINILNSLKSIDYETDFQLKDIPIEFKPDSLLLNNSQRQIQLKKQLLSIPSRKQFHKHYSGIAKPGQSHGFISKPLAINELTQPSIESTNKNDSITKSLSPSSTYHKCPFCQRQFKNKSYLSRHMKKHDLVKDFKCPFFMETSPKCHHLNGEFSRKDTFKAHLKSVHFIYPIGVTKADRKLSSGRCAGCFKEFKNNNEWLNKHIDNEECPGFAKYKLGNIQNQDQQQQQKQKHQHQYSSQAPYQL
ncbi:hypothetical protein WICMUC_004385 [Wickerhamomyces mucosus]|uniref:C2H2-type domain-containing protein n=1 Tax=Wickerhamomyces mucosus TaxID=1378264 RepID=A0A9P8TBD5_9ASCO|nr:hypothetical protein WICMUC_004385 [Wickerhamomyces mucosus]